MTLEIIMDELDIESGEDFRYFEQFAALMESPSNIDYDTFVELLMLPDAEDLAEMTTSFFEDLIKGIPDDNTELYSVIQTIKDTLISLAENSHERGRGFYAEELFRFREWLMEPGVVECTPEKGGIPELLSPCEAMMMFRQEKLSGNRYNYNFSDAMPMPPDDYLLDIIAEFSAYGDGSADYDYDKPDDYDDPLDELPIELPHDFDPDTYDPDNFDPVGPIDPYKDGFVDRYNPVIDGEDYGDEDDFNENFDDLRYFKGEDEF